MNTFLPFQHFFLLGNCCTIIVGKNLVLRPKRFFPDISCFVRPDKLFVKNKKEYLEYKCYSSIIVVPFTHAFMEVRGSSRYVNKCLFFVYLILCTSLENRVSQYLFENNSYEAFIVDWLKKPLCPIWGGKYTIPFLHFYIYISTLMPLFLLSIYWLHKQAQRIEIFSKRIKQTITQQ